MSRALSGRRDRPRRCSADKHVAGPRAGVLVGRKDLIVAIGSRAYELGLEAQAGQYVGVANALKNFDPRAVKEAGELAKELVEVLAREVWSRARLPRRAGRVDRGRRRARSRSSSAAARQTQLVAVEAAGLVAMEMLEKDGILTIGAVSMPGSAPSCG